MTVDVEAVILIKKKYIDYYVLENIRFSLDNNLESRISMFVPLVFYVLFESNIIYFTNLLFNCKKNQCWFDPSRYSAIVEGPRTLCINITGPD